MMKRAIGVGLLLILSTGCAANTSRMGVFHGGEKDPKTVAADKAECEFQARNLTATSATAEATVGAVVGIGAGAVIGAAFGAILGAFVGIPGEGAALGAAIGGFSGGLGGAAGGAEENRRVYLANYRACLSAMGYTVAY